MQKTAIYTRTSMLRVFTPGDVLELTEVDFSTFRRGDIVAFYPQGNEAPGVVHRIISRNSQILTTMGDNNDTPDAEPVTTAEHPLLVTVRIRRDGRRVRVHGGTLGICEFWWHRLRRRGRKVSARFLNGLLSLMFWRRTLTETARFGKQIVYYYKDKPILKRTPQGVSYYRLWQKLLYKPGPFK